MSRTEGPFCASWASPAILNFESYQATTLRWCPHRPACGSLISEIQSALTPTPDPRERASLVSTPQEGEGSASAFEASAEPNHIPTIDGRTRSTCESKHQRRRQRTPLPPAGRGRGWGSPGTPIAAYGNVHDSRARREVRHAGGSPPYENFSWNRCSSIRNRGISFLPSRGG
jgi:hypothetical protein